MKQTDEQHNALTNTANQKPELYRDVKGTPKGYRVGVADNAYGVCPFCGNSYSEQDIQDGKVNFEHIYSRFAVKNAIGANEAVSKIESNFMVAAHKDCNTASGEDLEEQIRTIIANLNKTGATLLPKDAELFFNYCIKTSVFLRYLTDYENVPKGFCYNNEKIDSEHSFYKDFNIRLRYVDSSAGLWWDATKLPNPLYFPKEKDNYKEASNAECCFTAVINGVEISFYPEKLEEKYSAFSDVIFLKRKENAFLYRASSGSPWKVVSQEKGRIKWCLEKVVDIAHLYKHHLTTLSGAALELNKNYFSRQQKLSTVISMPPEKQKKLIKPDDNGMIFYQGKEIYYVDNGVVKNVSELPARTEIPAVYLNGYVGSKLPKMSHLKINGDFIIINNSHLKSLQNIPQSVGGDFFCFCNKLTSLDGAPQFVGGNFCCFCNKLTSLDGAPKIIKNGSFYCSSNKLTSLKGAPESVKGDFSCSNNPLTSLSGAPKSVGGCFMFSADLLTNLDNLPIAKEYIVEIKYIKGSKGNLIGGASFKSADELRAWFAEYKKERDKKKKESLHAGAKKLKSVNTARDIKKQIVPDDQHGM